MRLSLSLHGAIRLVMVVVFAILVYQVTAASLRPPISSRIYGSELVWPGHEAVFRVLCLDADGLSPCAAPQIEAQWVRAQAGGTWQPQTTPAVIAADAEGTLRLPVPAPLPEGTALAVHIADGARTPVDDVHLPVQAYTPMQPVPGRLRPPLSLREPHAPSPMAQLWPADGSVIAGLRSCGLGQLLGEGANAAAALTGTADHALVVDTPSDAAGRFSWHACPQLKRTPWQLQRAPNARPLEAQVEAEPRQLSLSWREGPFIAAGSTLHVTLRTLPFRGPVHLDVWLGRALIAGLDATQGEHAIMLPQDAHGPLMLTAYRQSLAPDDTHVTQVGWVHSAAEPCAQDVQGLAAWLQVQTSAPRSEADVRWDVKARQGMFVPKAWGAPLLADSHSARQQAFSQAQTRRRKLGQSALLTTLSFGGFCALAYLRHFVQRRRAALVAASEETDRTFQARAMTRTDGPDWLWPAVGILMLMGAGLWQLMGHLVQVP